MIEGYFQPISHETEPPSSFLSLTQHSGQKIVIGGEGDNYILQTEPLVVAEEVIGNTEVKFAITSLPSHLKEPESPSNLNDDNDNSDDSENREQVENTVMTTEDPDEQLEPSCNVLVKKDPKN